MRSILAKSTVDQSQLLLAALPKSCRVNWRNTPGKRPESDSWHNIWKALAWSLQAAFEGKHPDKDHEGNPFEAGSKRALLAGKPLGNGNSSLKGLVWVLADDMELFANDWGLSSFSSNNPCFKCGCNKSNVPWNDFRPTAAWRSKNSISKSSSPTYSSPDIAAARGDC